MHQIKSFLFASLLLPLAACGQAAGSGAGDEAVDSAPSLEETMSSDSRVTELAEVEVPTGKVGFYAAPNAEGETSVFIAETARLGISETPVGKLLAKDSHTTLEIFVALTDDPAPEALVDAHAKEAAALGREDLAIQQVELELNDFVEKISQSSCDNAIFIPSSVWEYKKKRRWNAHSGAGSWYSLGAGGTNPPADWGYTTTSKITIGVCNDGNSIVTTRIAYDMEGDSEGWIYWNPRSVEVGHWWRAYGLHKTTCTGSPICTVNGTRYAIFASGARYHARSAEMEEVVR